MEGKKERGSRDFTAPTPWPHTPFVPVAQVLVTLRVPVVPGPLLRSFFITQATSCILITFT